MAKAQCVLPPPGLASWWSADGNANDIFGGNPGVLANGTTFATGIVSQAFSFDGTNDTVVNSGVPLNSMLNTFTLEFWVWPTASRANTTQGTSGTPGTGGQRYAIAPEHGQSGPAGAGVSVGTNGISVFEHASSYMPSLLVHPMTITNWTHVAVVYENKQPKLFLNGSLVRTGLVSQRATGVFPSKNFGNVNNYGPFRGLLDEVSIYNRALSSNEVQAIYAAGSVGKCKPAAPAPATVIYTNDFEGAIGTEWSATATDVTPTGGRRFLGRFAENQTVMLTLSNLPTHTNLTATFDLFIMNSWDGNNNPGPDVWEVAVVGGPVLLHTTFQNSGPSRLQAFPDHYPGGFYRARTGALETDTLGYSSDAVYRLHFTFPHSSSEVRLQFRGVGLQVASDESWGLDNIMIVADGPTVDLTSPTNGGAFKTPTNIVLTADAATASGAIQYVQFLSDHVLLGTVTNSPYSLVWSNAPAGLHVVTARATDDAGRTAESFATVRVNGLMGEYFNNTLFAGTPVTQLDPMIALNWLGKPPIQGVAGTSFTARWTGEIAARSSGMHTFYVSGDDRFRLWVDGRRIVDDWTGGSTHTRQGTISLVANHRYVIQLDFLQGSGGADIKLEWSSPNQALEVVSASQLFPPPSGVNRPPNASVITSPPADGWAMDPLADTLLRTDFFSDPDTGQTQQAAEWEIWLITPSELVWHSTTTGGGSLLTNQLSNGAFTNSHAGLARLLPDQGYQLRVRHKDDSGTTNSWGNWGYRYFNTHHTTLAASTFDSTAGGWSYWKTKWQYAPGFQWVSAGQPGGCLFIDEYSNGDGDTTWYRAPNEFLGNKSGCYGGYLEYDMRLTIPSENWDTAHVQLWSPNGMLVMKGPVEPGTDWTHFQVPLVPGSWHFGNLTGTNPTEQQFLAVLATLTNLLIRAEYIGTSYSDNCYLDNVRIVAPHSVTDVILLIQSGATKTATIEWPTNASEFQLQWTETLTTSDWQPVGVVPSASNGLFHVLIAATNGTAFFRLSKP